MVAREVSSGALNLASPGKAQSDRNLVGPCGGEGQEIAYRATILIRLEKFLRNGPRIRPYPDRFTARKLLWRNVWPDGEGAPAWSDPGRCRDSEEGMVRRRQR
jgi:hypothetical protein